MKYFITTVVIIITAAVAAGLWSAGSPSKERLRRFDGIRISHLQMIQSELYSYWSANKKLPDTLGVFDGKLTNGYSSFIPPKDPVTSEVYTYTKKDEDTFELCATFALPSEDTNSSVSYAPYGAMESWTHSTGNVCFERTFDKANWGVDVPVKN